MEFLSPGRASTSAPPKLVRDSVDFNLSELARGTLDLFHPIASQKGLLLSLAAPVGRSTMVRGDPFRLQQVISNLISNAVKFTHTGGVELRMNIRADGRRRIVSCEVADTGIGISAGAIDALFEPFTQADVSAAPRFDGTGLGLAISKRIVEAMDGSIEVESTEEHGTVFRFTVAMEAGTKKVARAEPQVAPSKRSLLVLLAEDNQVDRALVEAIVIREGHAIRSVENGLLAVAKASRDRFDVILMDMQMPGMDGLAATRAIRSGDGPCGDVPIIALTADAAADRRRFYENVGLTKFLTKPIDRKLLIHHLAEIAAQEPKPDVSPPQLFSDCFHLLDEEKIASLEEAVGDEALNKLIEMLDDELKKRPLKLQLMIEIDARSEVASEAHSLKGAAQNLGAERIGELARLIEVECEAGRDLVSLGHQLVAAAAATRLQLKARETGRRSA